MPHTPGHTQSVGNQESVGNQAGQQGTRTPSPSPTDEVNAFPNEVRPTPDDSFTYRIYGTNEPYSGMVVEVGGYLYTTSGGALEGVPHGQQVVAIAPIDEPTQNTPLAGQTQTSMAEETIEPESMSDTQNLTQNTPLQTSTVGDGTGGTGGGMGGY